MALAPTNTYDSDARLDIAQVPLAGLEEDEILYAELLDIHNALGFILQHGDDFVTKFRNNTPTNVDYTVVTTDGTIEVDASLNDVIITMHAVADGVGYRYNIKRIDTVTTNKVTIVGNGAELIDNRAAGINVSIFSSYTVKGNDDEDGWNII